MGDTGEDVRIGALASRERWLAITYGFLVVSAALRWDDDKSTLWRVTDLIIMVLGTMLLAFLALAWWHRRRTGQDVARHVGVDVTWWTPTTCPTCGAPVVGERHAYDSRLGPLYRERRTCSAAGAAHLDDPGPMSDGTGKKVAR
ncbi:hypothetical protein ACOACO_00850 [Nocardioides sp. CPCC 205120]|uniref:hypothetical protein n=1 Tax=Nocardioides sp. CPCC 205120 TaxID=3406462 RepID=UPI003B50CF66